MKLYEFEAFPNPKRVRMFLAEKGVDIERVQVNVPAGEHRTERYKLKNPDGTVPFVELDDGRVISGCVAISRYIEASTPANPLMGETPAEAAEISMWQRRVEDGLMDASTTYYHHATEGLGELEPYQIKEWGQKNGERAKATIASLNERLADQDYIAGSRFSIADITAFAGYGFAKYVGLADDIDVPHVDRWFANIGERASASA